MPKNATNFLLWKEVQQVSLIRGRGDDEFDVDELGPSPVSGARITVKKKESRRRLATPSGGGVETPPTCLSEDQHRISTTTPSHSSPEKKDRKAKKKRLKKAKAVIGLDLL